mgnify:CR=1 FL=1
MARDLGTREHADQHARLTADMAATQAQFEATAEQTARFLADRNNTPFVVLAPAKTIYPGDKALGLFDQR